MKKLFINLILAISLNYFTSATPTSCISLIKVASLNKAYVSAYCEVEEQKAREFEIHPLDILVLKFN
jgi:hypothetical protein